MGLIKHKHTVETIDLHNYDPEYNEDGTEKHIVYNGARFHVVSYTMLGQVCSVKNCEINSIATIGGKRQ